MACDRGRRRRTVGTVRVLTWNVQCLRGGSSARVASIADAVARHAPDAVALQEVSADAELLGTLRAELRTRGFAGFHFGAPDPKARKRYGNVVASTGTVVSNGGGAAAGGDLHWRHLITSANVTTRDGFELELFSVHIPNGSGNGWAKVDAFIYLADVLTARPLAPRVVAGDFNEPWRFNGDVAESFACKDGLDLDTPWTRDGKHESFEPRPRREWQDAVDRVLGARSPIGVRRFVPAHVADACASHVTRNGKPRLFDHILGSSHLRCAGLEYDHSVREATSAQRLSDHSIVVGDLTLAHAVEAP